MADIFGPMTTGATIEQAIKSTIRSYAPAYLGEVGHRSGRAVADLPTFASWPAALEIDKFPEDQLPACIVVVAGIGGDPVRRGDGSYDVPFAAGVGAAVKGMDRENTLELVYLYTAALRAILLQHPSLGGVASGMTWIGERYNELTTTDLRTIGVGSVQVTVDIKNVVNVRGGPKTPPDDPAEPGTAHVAEYVSTSITRRDT